jgi:hypothetical protein
MTSACNVSSLTDNKLILVADLPCSENGSYCCSLGRRAFSLLFLDVLRAVMPPGQAAGLVDPRLLVQPAIVSTITGDSMLWPRLQTLKVLSSSSSFLPFFFGHVVIKSRLCCIALGHCLAIMALGLVSIGLVDNALVKLFPAS